MNNQSVVDLEPKKQKLMGEINQFVETYQKRHSGNFHLNWILIVIGLLLSAGVTVAGMLNQGLIAAVLGICIGFLLGLQNAFPLGEKAEFYRLMIVEGQNLISVLNYEVDTLKEFEDSQKRFRKLRSHAAASLPKGRGMEAVKEMYKDFSRKDTA